MKILIVEDQPDERLLFEEYIRSFGYDVTACTNAQTALNACQDTPYSLVVLDLGLPDMDGVELCRRIRSLPQGDQCMILVITGRDEPEDLPAALEAGANDFLRKPISREDLNMRMTILEQQLQGLTRRKKVEDAFRSSVLQIERAKQEWEFTADSLAHVICLLDNQGRIMRANRTIEDWNLRQVKGIKGLGIHELFHPNCQESNCALQAFLLRAREEISRGESVEGEFDEKHLQRILHIQIRPISIHTTRRSKRLESFAVLVANDITAYKQLQETLSRQDRLLLGVAGAMNYLLIIPDFQKAVISALKVLGLAADVDRVYIVESHLHPETREPLMSQRFEWDRFSKETHIDNPEFQNIPYSIGFTRWYEMLKNNETISGLVKELPPEECEMLDHQNIMSILVVPITIGDRFWGFIGFDNCHAEHQWREEEEAVLMAMAGSIGGAIAREQGKQQLHQTSTELRAIFQALPDEYFRLDADGSILDYKVNQNTEIFNSETFMGQWASGLLPDKIERQFDKILKRVHQTKESVSIEYKLPVSDGQKERCEEVRLVPFLHDQVIVVTRDITGRKQAEEALKKQLQQETAKRKQMEEELHQLKQA